MGHVYYEFRVHLRYIEPEIWRSFILPADASFKDLHLAIQDSFGWQQAHLYEFMRQFKRSAQTIAGIPKEMRTRTTGPHCRCPSQNRPRRCWSP